MKINILFILLFSIVCLAGCSDKNITDSKNQINIKECVDGMAAGQYPCKNIGLYAHLTPVELLGERLNDIWGWTDPQTGIEYALVCMTDGVTFVNISNPAEPVVVGTLPESHLTDANVVSNNGQPRVQHHEGKSAWRDLKVYNNFAFVVSDAQPHGMQVFDLTRLRNVTNPPKVFEADVLYDKIANAHNIAINTETGYAYIVGSNTYGGLHIVDITNPLQPTFAGFHSDSTVGIDSTGYVHDTQCVIYNGPDIDYQSDEICFNSSETHFVIANVTNKDSTYTISKGTYDGVAYTHQGWLTTGQKYFLLGDELDEYHQAGNTRTIIWDVTDLDNPLVIGIYKSPVKAIGHNMYTKNGLLYQSNYTAGLRILSLEGVASGQLTEIAYFDTFPIGDGAKHNGEPYFVGTWSNYPYFESGVVIVSDITNGLFILKARL